MKKLFCLFIFYCILGCNDYIDKPENLIEKKKMSEILADMAMNDQASLYNPTNNLETGTRYILKQYKISADQFVESYKYYAVTKKLQEILTESQEIVTAKHPDAEKYIQKKLKEQSKVPAFAK